VNVILVLELSQLLARLLGVIVDRRAQDVGLRQLACTSGVLKESLGLVLPSMDITVQFGQLQVKLVLLDVRRSLPDENGRVDAVVHLHQSVADLAFSLDPQQLVVDEVRQNVRALRMDAIDVELSGYCVEVLYDLRDLVGGGEDLVV